VGEGVRGEVDRLHIGLAGKVERWSVLVLALAVAGALAVDRGAAAGIALGGGVSLGLFGLHRALVRSWLEPTPRRRRARIWFWSVWFVKWPALGLLVYGSVSRAWVTPLWLCVGVALVPGVTTALALRALLIDGLHRGTAGARH
jgi:hypothetical protein